jgi:hypothetical protein
MEKTRVVPLDAPEHQQPEAYRLDVYLEKGEVVDVQVNGQSVWPVWFKIEWKGTGDVSAKVRGIRLSTRQGDEIKIHEGRPSS